MLVLFRRSLLATPDSTIAPYVALNEYWDNVKRTVYRQQEPSPLNNPSEVALNTELARYAVRPGTVRVARYGGNGQVYTADEAATGGPASGGVCTLAAPDISPNPATTSRRGVADATITVTGRLGVPPYAIAVRAAGEATILASGTSASTQQPAQLTGLPAGRFEVSISDAAGCARTGPLTVYEPADASYGPYGYDLRVMYNPSSGLYRYFWNPASRAVETFSRNPVAGESATDDYDNKTPPGTPIDGYLLPDGYTFRRVYSDGSGGVTFSDTDTRRPGLLALQNLILFHPDVPGAGGGGVLVECTATDYPLSFQLGDGTGTTYGPPNATGHFDNLTEDDFAVVVTDALGRTLTVPFALRARYNPRWRLTSDSLDSTGFTATIWKLGYGRTEPVEDLCGEAAPLTLRSDGLNSAIGGQGDIPAAIGTSVELSLLATVEQLAEIQQAEDRAYRVDYERNGVLEFRGYITPDIYTAELLDGLVPVHLTATDGLATLKDTIFTGHIGQPLTGRWPLLNTLLHCLSRCDVALPLRIATNRRPAELPTRLAPEAGVLSERAGYTDEKGAPLDMRTVVEAVAQALGGTLVQRAGGWEIRAALEAANASTPARAYQAAGTPVASPAPVLAPAGLVRPPAVVRAAGAGWLWENNSQQLSIRAGWKSLAAKTDVFYAKNALPAGEVFGTDTAWNQSLDALLPSAGWHENADAPGFPLLLERAGEKDTDLGTRWPRNPGNSDALYLQSEQLPNAPEPEGVPWVLSVTGRLVLPTPDGQAPPPAPAPAASFADLPLELIIDGQRPVLPYLARFTLPTGTGAASDTTLTFELPPIPAGAKVRRLRVLRWQGATNLPAAALLLIKSIAIQLKPQGATWDGKDNFLTTSGQGTVRPTEALNVFHADVPLKAGLFEGSAGAFRRALTVAGGALTTTWSRPDDVAAAPLLEASALDVLALRAAPSRLLSGTVRYMQSAPPRMLDAVDLPNDVDGRRFLVVAVREDVRGASTEVSLVEIGRGLRLAPPDPLEGYPNGVRLLDGVDFPPGATITPGGGQARARATHHGLRIAKPV